MPAATASPSSSPRARRRNASGASASAAKKIASPKQQKKKASSSSSSSSSSSKKAHSKAGSLSARIEGLLRTDYHWVYTDEPHASRRKEMLAKYPQIKALMGPDPGTKWQTAFWVGSQLALACLVAPRASWQYIFVLAYCYGAFAAHALFLAMHEISHNLAFKQPWANRFLGVFANLGTIFPHFSMFQRYHMEHHQYQGVDGVDTDVPTRFEGEWITGTVSKALWVLLMPLVYVFRPLFVKPKSPGKWEAINWTACFAMAAAIYYFYGVKALSYLLLSGLIGSGFHPIAGHFISEHYVFLKGTEQETYSYYGPLNYITFNVGFHNEHHDFPRIPGSRLHCVRAIAPEYYEDLHEYNSWFQVIINYITDPSVGPFSRVLRKSKNRA